MKKISIAILILLLAFLILMRSGKQIFPESVDVAYIRCLKIVPGENPISLLEIKDAQEMLAWEGIRQSLNAFHYLPSWPSSEGYDQNIEIILTYNAQTTSIVFTGYNYVMLKYGNKTKTYLALTKQPIFYDVQTLIEKSG